MGGAGVVVWSHRKPGGRGVLGGSMPPKKRIIVYNLNDTVVCFLKYDPNV